MANQKISQLTTKTTPVVNDVLPIVDSVAGDNKKITIGTIPVSTPIQSAIDAKVQDSITDGVTTIAPSQNAVFDALALKQNSIGFTPENVANKSTTTTLGTSNTLYPTQNAVKVYADGKISKDVSTTYTTNAIKTLTTAEYMALGTPDANTLYFIV